MKSSPAPNTNPSKPTPFSPGPRNAITDVTGVRVGHLTLIDGEDIRTGVTAILPHGGNLFQEKVPAGLAVANGFGKLMGGTQLAELGELETPVVLTNTLAVPRAADGIIDWTLRQPGNETVRSVNPVVGETNDGYLNNIRRRIVTAAAVAELLDNCHDGDVRQGCVGAGTGTIALGWKGGIGTASRQVPLPTIDEAYTIGVLVQSNFGGTLPHSPTPPALANQPPGSIMIVIATNAPLSNRNLTRLAKRAFAGMARTGAAFSNGSGDYALAFSTAAQVRRTPARRTGLASIAELPNALLSPLFLAVAHATEAAIYNSLKYAVTTKGYLGLIVEALPNS